MSPLQRFDDTSVQELLAWYARERRPFPWRLEPDPYRVWIAEIMSQQTRMAALVPYFYRFVERFPRIENLAKAPLDEVYKVWAGLGYYSRARNLHKCAQIVAGELNGDFPRTLDGWLSLPGVGPYTAAAVVSQCFGVHEPVWDGNVLRVCARLDASKHARSPRFREDAIAVLREKMRGHNPSHFNQALMELGALVCTPKSPGCGRCPLRPACVAAEKEKVSFYPTPKPKREVIDVACDVLILMKGAGESREVLLKPRDPKTWFSGFWDFPSQLGGVDQPVAPLKAQRLRGAKSLRPIPHSITHHKISLRPKLYELDSGGPRQMHAQLRSMKHAGGTQWFKLAGLVADAPPIPLSTTAKKVLKRLFHTFPDLLA